MTGFARISGDTPQAHWIWELKSVNHRYLEPALRLPEACKALEAETRKLLGQYLKRGKLDISLRYQINNTDNRSLKLNRALLQQLRETEREVLDIIHAGHAMNVIDFLQWPGVLQESEIDLSGDQEPVLGWLEQALQQLVANRQQEGHAIELMLLERLDAMQALSVQLRQCRPQLIQSLRQKLEKLLQQHLDKQVSVDPARLEQELVLLAQKLDVDEEMDRLDAHLQEVRDVLQRAEPVGRRLDFLMQELNREANTLSSKSQDIETTRIAVDMKVLIEQMREQIQNIE